MPDKFCCPFCHHHASLRTEDLIKGSKLLNVQVPIDGHKYLDYEYIVCLNPDCRKSSLNIKLIEAKPLRPNTERFYKGNTIKNWQLIPESNAKAFPEYIPKAILEDYLEACLIVKHSAKASATLSRRCLQGIIRDFWKVKPGRLVDEIDQIEDEVDSLTWEAIDAVRKVGNIGAHMEKDINLIIDVDTEEASVLIGLIETLITNWYIEREEKAKRLNNIREIAANKTTTH